MAAIIDVAGEPHEAVGFNTVFRCSDHIIDLASCVLASGATLFSQLENPLYGVSGGFTFEEENLCRVPYIVQAMGFDDLISKSFSEVNNIAKELQVSRNDILMIPCDEFTQEKMKGYCDDNYFDLVSIESRGDVSAVEKASKCNAYISGCMDFIGGLEFPAIVIVGIDSDKFPKENLSGGEASHFIKYSSFNQLYVAITRAKYVIAFITDRSKGVSETIQNALDNEFIVQE